MGFKFDMRDVVLLPSIHVLIVRVPVFAKVIILLHQFDKMVNMSLGLVIFEMLNTTFNNTVCTIPGFSGPIT